MFTLPYELGLVLFQDDRDNNLQYVDELGHVNVANNEAPSGRDLLFTALCTLHALMNLFLILCRRTLYMLYLDLRLLATRRVSFPLQLLQGPKM